MKLKIYLRGLGIGVVVTALLMGYTGGKQKMMAMTDEQIIARAQELGMVQEAQVMLPVSGNVKEKDSADESKENPELKTENRDADNTKNDAVKAEEKSEVQTEEPTAEMSGTVTLEIANGSGSTTVSALLKKGGLVDSAEAFDRYLCEYGYDKRITAGIHEIPENADYETIAEIITTR